MSDAKLSRTQGAALKRTIKECLPVVIQQMQGNTPTAIVQATARVGLRRAPGVSDLADEQAAQERAWGYAADAFTTWAREQRKSLLDAIDLVQMEREERRADAGV